MHTPSINKMQLNHNKETDTQACYVYNSEPRNSVLKVQTIFPSRTKRKSEYTVACSPLSHAGLSFLEERRFWN